MPELAIEMYQYPGPLDLGTRLWGQEMVHIGARPCEIDEWKR